MLYEAHSFPALLGSGGDTPGTGDPGFIRKLARSQSGPKARAIYFLWELVAGAP